MVEIEWSLFSANMKRYARYIVLFFVIYLIMDQVAACSPMVRLPLVIAKRPIYQVLYASGREEVPLKTFSEEFTPVKDPNPYQVITVNGRKISKTFVVALRAYGRVAYLDTNDSLLKGWYLSSMNEESAWLYKKVAPYDIFMAYGSMAKIENFKRITFGHEENLGQIKCSGGVKINRTEYENIHMLPANSRIKKAVSILKKGDLVYLEGFLTDWDTPEKPRDKQWYRTARFAGEISRERAGGRVTGLCQQLYLTKVILNGYVYK